MKKKLSNYKNGFVLAETLIAAVFASALFVIIFINFYPLIGEYEKIENYDDIPSKYQAFWIRRLVESNETSSTFKDKYKKFKECPERRQRNLACSFPLEYIDISKCEDLFDSNTTAYNNCNNLYNTIDVEEAVITRYKTTGIKSQIFANKTYSEEFKDYIAYLPNYEIKQGDSTTDVDSLYDFKYRVIVRFKNEAKDEFGENGKLKYYSYATLEVK